MGRDQQGERVAWRDGLVPVSTLFDDPYFSIHHGLEESRHVFLAGNDLPARLAPGFQIAELGFGTGLNLLATCLAAEATGTAGPIHYTSFEAYPMPVADMRAALAQFDELAALAPALLAHWQEGARQFDLGALRVEVVTGDARQTLPLWQSRADAWYLDGFSPAKNPELWSESLMQAVGRATAAGGSFATYSAAGHVRRALAGAGFEVTRVAGYGHKRHMSRGRKPMGQT